MNKAVQVVIPLDEYKDLLELESAMKNGKAIVRTDMFMDGHRTTIYTKKELDKKLTEEVGRAQRFEDNQRFKAERLEATIRKLKKMNWREFKKWRNK